MDANRTPKSNHMWFGLRTDSTNAVNRGSKQLDWSGMTKQQIIDAVSTTTERPKAEVETVVDSLLTEIGKALRSGERVDLRGFGSFVVKDKKARQGRNPKTGETIQIAARRAATFKPSKELSDKLAAESLATTGQV